MKFTLEEVLKDKKNQEETVELIKDGAVFIYPTDTIYGIGCDAANAGSVRKIRQMKKATHPFSVIAPSKAWVRENLVVTEKTENHLKKLPGPCTLVLKKKKSSFLKSASSTSSLGIRIPDHPFTGIIQRSGRPFVTTSVNLSGKPYITEVKDIPPGFKADVIIDSGTLKAAPSAVLDLTGEKPAVLRKFY